MATHVNCKQTLASYEKYWDSVSVEKTLISGAKEEGREEGIVLGEKKGLEKGIALGEEKGRQETQEALAINLINMTVLTDAQIATATGLPLKTIIDLREK